jgi:hypothetical protein
MAKNAHRKPERRSGAIRSNSTGALVEGEAGSGRFRRVILYPTEPTSIDPKRIERAVERAISRKK